MSLLIVLGLLLALALTVPFLGADSRYPGSGDRPDRADRPRRGERYRTSWDAAIAEKVSRGDFDRTS